MTAKKRFLTALKRQVPDRPPVTTHHLMQSFLTQKLNNMTIQEFFDHFQLDPINWVDANMVKSHSDESDNVKSEYNQFGDPLGFTTTHWQINKSVLSSGKIADSKYSFITPGKTLSMVLQSNIHTTWIVEPLIKEKKDIEIFEKYAPVPVCEVEKVNKEAENFGNRGLIRGAIPGFDFFGQPGCWQDAATLFGIEELIMETFNDPDWVHSFLKILLNRKKEFVLSASNANFDILELGGGSASTTVISPEIFDEFITPYDIELIELAHRNNQKIVYHICGGMMPILEMVAEMNPDAMETFTPPSLGGDSDLKEAKKRVGDKVCMIGGFDQSAYFVNCTPEETRKAVRKCFQDAGENGGYILAPSDHFFDADIECLMAFSDEARKCMYN
ncbi:uroporphyrinogen decarboxylase family protein [Bacteroidota bacterium]